MRGLNHFPAKKEIRQKPGPWVRIPPSLPKFKWAVSIVGKTLRLHREVGSSILPRSTKFSRMYGLTTTPRIKARHSKCK